MNKNSWTVAGTLLLLLAVDAVDGLQAQIQVGTVVGAVVDVTGGALPGAEVTLSNALSGFLKQQVTDNEGRFEFNNVPFNEYVLRVEFAGFRSKSEELHLHSNVPVNKTMILEVGLATESIEVEAFGRTIQPERTGSKVTLDSRTLEKTASTQIGKGLAPILAQTPGWVPDDNGRLHVRGTESAVLYVVDGVPIVDRMDTAFASPLDPRQVESLEIFTGNIPAEFGNRLGGVVNVNNKSGLDQPFQGGIDLFAGNFRRGQAAFNIGGAINHQFALNFSGLLSRSDRFLDPPSEANFNNRGKTVDLNLKLEWHPNEKDLVRVVLSGAGTDFQVPNRAEQQLAGQRTRQELRRNSQSVMWQRVWDSNTVTNIAVYRNFFRARLKPNGQEIPISANQDREHSQQGLLASFSRHIGRHNIKAGLEMVRTPIQESFEFFITRPDQVEVTPFAARFQAGNPFQFHDKIAGEQYSAFLQGSFKFVEHLTVDAGIRYDNYHLLVAEDEFSPRVGAVYFVPQSQTAFRASFNHFFMPPQNENLLLASSPQAARLSPLASERGFAPIRPDEEDVWEVGFAQSILGAIALDIAYYWRDITNFHDRDQFLDTGIIFPISIAEGDVEGLDVSLKMPSYKGFSAWGSWSNSRAFGIGPIDGGLFLSEEVEELGPGVVFPNDHDQRNTVSFGVTYARQGPAPWWVTFQGRHDSGLPLEVDDEALPRLKELPGADLVNFDRQRVKAHTTFGLSGGVELIQANGFSLKGEVHFQNLFDSRFVHNFESVFGGTHFGDPRLYAFQLKIAFD